MTDETDQRLSLYISRIENLREERKAISADITDVFSEAASAGYDKKALREVIRLRAMPADDRAELQAVLDTYMAALGCA